MSRKTLTVKMTPGEMRELERFAENAQLTIGAFAARIIRSTLTAMLGDEEANKRRVDVKWPPFGGKVVETITETITERTESDDD